LLFSRMLLPSSCLRESSFLNSDFLHLSIVPLIHQYLPLLPGISLSMQVPLRGCHDRRVCLRLSLIRLRGYRPEERCLRNCPASHTTRLGCSPTHPRF